MIFNTIRPGKRLLAGVWSAVFLVEVVLKPSMVVGADPVPVVTLQTLFIARCCQEAMRGGGAIGEIQMAGRAAGSVLYVRIGVAAGIGVTAETAPTQQVVCQLQSCFRCIDNRDPGEIAQCFDSAKGLANQIDLILQGKMN